MREMKSSLVNRILATLAALLLILSGCSSHAAEQSLPTLPAFETTGGGNQDLLDCLFFDAASFEAHVAKAVSFPLQTLSAGVVPHHLLAGQLIASFFQSARDTGETYDTVIILGPNHLGEGADITIADRGFHTYFGDVACDEDAIGQILACKPLQVRVDDDLLQSDHAVSSLIPYLKYYLPDAKVVSLLLSRRVTMSQTQDLAQLLNSIANDKKCLIVGSVDFSHGLSTEDAAIEDKRTREAMIGYDFEAIKEMPNENLDSPETLCTLLCYFAERGEKTVSILNHKSAADFLNGTQLHNCTTYFVLGCP